VKRSETSPPCSNTGQKVFPPVCFGGEWPKKTCFSREGTKSNGDNSVTIGGQKGVKTVYGLFGGRVDTKHGKGGNVAQGAI